MLESLSKQELRLTFARQRSELTPNIIKKTSSQILDKLTKLRPLQAPKTIHIYLPVNNEVDSWPIAEWLWEREHEVWASHLSKAEVNDGFVRLTPETKYALGRHGTPLPLGEVHTDCEPSVVIVPGLAFDKQGYRLGHGGGWYDRFLAAHPEARRVGVIDHQFLIAELPRETHDQPLDIIVTNQEIIHTEAR